MKTAVKKSIIKSRNKFKEGRDTFLRFFIYCLAVIFYYGWKGSVWFYDTFLTEVYERGNNGIFGPGHHSWALKQNV